MYNFDTVINRWETACEKYDIIRCKALQKEVLD